MEALIAAFSHFQEALKTRAEQGRALSHGEKWELWQGILRGEEYKAIERAKAHNSSHSADILNTIAVNREKESAEIGDLRHEVSDDFRRLVELMPDLIAQGIANNQKNSGAPMPPMGYQNNNSLAMASPYAQPLTGSPSGHVTLDPYTWMDRYAFIREVSAIRMEVSAILGEGHSLSFTPAEQGLRDIFWSLFDIILPPIESA